jgi:hypothetical protein
MNVNVREIAARLFIEYASDTNKPHFDPNGRQRAIERRTKQAIADAEYFMKELDVNHPDGSVEFPENFGKSLYAQ